MKKIVLVVFMLFVYISTSLAQNNLNAYKYIIVPKNFEFLQKADEYEINSLTKFLFEKKGFKTLFEGDRHPVDLFENPCLGLVVDIKDDSSMFTSKLTLYLTNCNKKVVFTAMEGKSKEKDYKKTYQQALRKSFASVEELDYKFDPDLVITNPEDVKSTTVIAAPIVVGEVKRDTKTNTENKSEEVNTDTVVDVPFVVIEDTEVKEEPKEEVSKEVMSKNESSILETPKTDDSKMMVVATTPIVESKTVNDKKNKQDENVKAIARSYKNENISFFLIDQNNNLVAYVIESKIDSYKKGEMIGTFVKTSLPNVFKVSWKNKQKGIDETIAYFDDAGNLKVEINRNGKMEVIVFKAEK